MSNTAKKKNSLVGIILLAVLAIAIACMIFPTGIYYKGTGDKAIFKVPGLEATFGGFFLNNTLQRYTVASPVAIIGFFLPVVAVVLFLFNNKVLNWVTVFLFLASFVLLFCAKAGFVAINGSESYQQYANGVGPIVGACLGIVGFIVSFAFTIKAALAK